MFDLDAITKLRDLISPEVKLALYRLNLFV